MRINFQYFSWVVVIMGVSISGSTLGLLLVSISLNFQYFVLISIAKNKWLIFRNQSLRMLKDIWYILYSEYSGYRVFVEWYCAVRGRPRVLRAETSDFGEESGPPLLTLAAQYSHAFEYQMPITFTFSCNFSQLRPLDTCI